MLSSISCLDRPQNIFLSLIISGFLQACYIAKDELELLITFPPLVSVDITGMHHHIQFLQ